MIYTVVASRKKCGVRMIFYLSLLVGNTAQAAFTMPFAIYFIIVSYDGQYLSWVNMILVNEFSILKDPVHCFTHLIPGVSGTSILSQGCHQDVRELRNSVPDLLQHQRLCLQCDQADYTVVRLRHHSGQVGVYCVQDLSNNLIHA